MSGTASFNSLAKSSANCCANAFNRLLFGTHGMATLLKTIKATARLVDINIQVIGDVTRHLNMKTGKEAR